MEVMVPEEATTAGLPRKAAPTTDQVTPLGSPEAE